MVAKLHSALFKINKLSGNQINRVLLWLLLFINLMRFCVVFFAYIKTWSRLFRGNVVQKYKSISWLTLKGSFMLHARYRFGRRCSSVAHMLNKGRHPAKEVIVHFSHWWCQWKGLDWKGVFNGLTGHRRLQVCLLLNRCFIMSPSSGRVGFCCKHLTLYHRVNFWSFIDDRCLHCLKRTDLFLFILGSINEPFTELLTSIVKCVGERE